MKSRLIIQQSALDLGLNNACAAVVDNISVSDDQSFVSLLQSNLNHVASHLNELDANPVYEGFARQLEKLGYTNTVSANEKLLRRFIANGVRPINNVVDAYNAVAIRHGVSIGVHSYHQRDDIHVMRSPAPRAFRPLFAKKDVMIPAGDIVYTCGDVPLASIGKVDADAHDFRLTNASSSLLVVVLGHDHTTLEFNQTVIAEFVDTLRQTMPALNHYFLETFHDHAPA